MGNMNFDLKINSMPPSRWMRRLKQGHTVWLVKEKLWASIACPWIPPEPGYRSGQISLRRIEDKRLRPAEQWYVGVDGQGLDGSQLMFPAQGHLADVDVPLSDLHAIYERLEKIENRLKEMSFPRLFGIF